MGHVCPGLPSLNKRAPPGKLLFWTWLDKIPNLVPHDHLKDLWNDGCFMGFVSQSQECQLLKTIPGACCSSVNHQEGVIPVRWSIRRRQYLRGGLPGGNTCTEIRFSSTLCQPYIKMVLQRLTPTERIHHYQQPRTYCILSQIA